MTHEELAHWLGISVREVPLWKAGYCEREIVTCNELARAMQAKAAGGDRRAVAVLRQVERHAEMLRRSRQFWAAMSV